MAWLMLLLAKVAQTIRLTPTLTLTLTLTLISPITLTLTLTLTPITTHQTKNPQSLLLILPIINNSHN